MKAVSRSLHFRILSASIAVSAVALIATGLLLSKTFTRHIEERFNQVLASSMNDLIAASEVDNSDQLQLRWRPSDPRYNTPFSGWYWMIYTEESSVVAVSDSLPGAVNAEMLLIPAGGTKLQAGLVGPDGARLKALARKIQPLGGDRYLYYLVTGPESDVDGAVASFSSQLMISLVLVALAFLLITFFQLRWIIDPLLSAKRELQQIRKAEKPRLDQEYPNEISPLVTEINNLLDDNNAMLSRARLQASNLAHAIKNPLTVMRNQSQGEEGERMRQQIDKLDSNINRHLSRFRIAGLVNRASNMTLIAPVLDDILHSVEIIHRRKNLEITLDCQPQLFFEGDQHDLEELLGNLIDNACKWATSIVGVAAGMNNDRIFLTISDDGEGVPESEQKKIFSPGKRLDESANGQGLGLAIVSDIVELYGGTIALNAANGTGGSMVSLTLPGGLSGKDAGQ